MDQLLATARRWVPMLTLLVFAPYVLAAGLPDVPSWESGWAVLRELVVAAIVAAAVYMVSALVHEALHLCAMIVVGRVPFSSLKFGARLREGVLYVHTNRVMSARAYRTILLTPAVVLGLLPVGIGMLLSNGWLVLYGYVMLVSAIGDLAVLHHMRHIDPAASVRDHPADIGCQVRAVQTGR